MLNMRDTVSGRVSRFKTALDGSFLIEINRKFYSLPNDIDINTISLYGEWEVEQERIGFKDEFPMVKPV